MKIDSPIVRQLRYRIIGWLHVGRIRRGDRLPSIREVAKESGADHRAVADAYRVLEAEGLVEIRPGSGVYVATADRTESVGSETVGWLGGILAEGWSRGISRSEVGDLVGRCARVQLRCACIESTEDHMVALCAEMEEGFSLETEAVLVDTDAEHDAVTPERLATADLVVTTVFHAKLGRAAAAAAGKPAVIVGINPEFAAELRRRLHEQPMTAVVVDPLYRVRGQAYIDATSDRGRARFVLVDELADNGGEIDPESEAVLLTRAARRRLGLKEYHYIPSPPNVISPESAWELCNVIARLALQAGPG